MNAFGRGLVGLSQVFLIAACASPEQATGVPDPFDAAMIAARDNDRTSEGRAFQQAGAPRLGPALTPLARTCRETAPEGARLAFRLLIQIDVDGHAMEVLVRPSTPYSECMRSAVRSIGFLKPPADRYWVRLDMQTRAPLMPGS